MSPREYLRQMRRRLSAADGSLAPGAPIEATEGETVGVVLLGPGGPESPQEVRHYLYRVLMDPVSEAVPGPSPVRHLGSRFLAWQGAKRVRSEYEAIGGRAPIVRHAYEQAHALQGRLLRAGTPVLFRTYVAMRHGQPSTEETFERLADDGVERAVLVPLFPQYALSRTGSSLAYWQAVAPRARTVPRISVVREYAEEPGFVQAVGERIDEALQRFPRELRPSVRFVFVAHGASAPELRSTEAGYCCQVHRTVDAVMRSRDGGQAFEVAFQRPMGIGNHLEPLLEDTLTSLADRGHRNVLVIPVSIVTEQVDIAYRLDVMMRRHAEASGITRYEVAAPLNCHPLLLESLTRSVLRRVQVDGRPLRAPVETPEVAACPRASWGSDGAAWGRCRQCGRALGDVTVRPALKPEPVQPAK